MSINDLHPDIRKFWEQQATSIMKGNIGVYAIEDTMNWTNRRVLTVCYFDLSKADIDDYSRATYYYNDNKYTEAEMLRVIKLKAFV